MKILAISDQHGILPKIPECDLLLIAGDICPTYDHRPEFQLQWFNSNYKNWLQSIKADKIILTFGNHDFFSEEAKEEIWSWQHSGFVVRNYDVLLNDVVTYKDLKIWASPYGLWFHDWAWNAYEPELEKIYSKIPDDVDIIITHGPPKLHGDRTSDHCDAGSQALLDKMESMSKKVINICGHIHEGYGHYKTPKGNDVYNVSILNERYKFVNPITEIII